jgi:hypothetical protein
MVCVLETWTIGLRMSAIWPRKPFTGLCFAVSTDTTCSTVIRILGTTSSNAADHLGFLDYGLVKEFTQSEMDMFWTMIRYQVIDRDPVAYRSTVEAAGLLVPGAPFSTQELMDYFGYFYHPVMDDTPFTYTSSYAREALKRTFDPAGEHTDMMKWFNLPPAFIVLNRIQWGLNAVLAGLEGTANWRAISEELWPFTDRAASTPMGELEHQWLRRRSG